MKTNAALLFGYCDGMGEPSCIFSILTAVLLILLQVLERSADTGR